MIYSKIISDNVNNFFDHCLYIELDYNAGDSNSTSLASYGLMPYLH